MGIFTLKYNKQWITLLTPLLLLPMVYIRPSAKMSCGYVMLVMIVYWCTQVVPLAITALLPILLLPLFGISTSKEVTSQYIKNTNTVIMGGLIVAQAIQTTGLHKRIAVHAISKVGPNLRWLMMGFQVTTCLISMCIVNTAAVAMMLPILTAVTSEFYPKTKAREVAEEQRTNATGSSDSVSRSDVEMNHIVEDESEELWIPINTSNTREKKNNKDRRQLEIALTLSIVYAANLGGVGILTGTGPNLVMKQFIDQWFSKHGMKESPINFATWLGYGLPIAIMNIIILWLWFQCLFIGPLKMFSKRKDNEEQDRKINEAIQKEKDKLGKIRFGEYVVSILFVILVGLWFFRAPGFMHGWAKFFKPMYVSTATPPILIVFLLFVIPMNFPARFKDGHMITILDWKKVQKSFPWGILFLMGGGFAIGHASVKTGLSQTLGSKLSILGELPEVVMIYLICFAIGMFTEFASNMAVCTMLMPIVATMATELGYSPLYLMLPVGVTSSLAFVLPVSNPPNALGFEYAQLTVKDMLKCGWALKLLTIMPVTLVTQTIGYWQFHFDTIPTPHQHNVTAMTH